jgi:hypothetical protein
MMSWVGGGGEYVFADDCVSYAISHITILNVRTTASFHVVSNSLFTVTQSLGALYPELLSALLNRLRISK